MFISVTVKEGKHFNKFLSDVFDKYPLYNNVKYLDKLYKIFKDINAI